MTSARRKPRRACATSATNLRGAPARPRRLTSATGLRDRPPRPTSATNLRDRRGDAVSLRVDAGDSVDELAKNVEVAGVTRGLFDHVGVDPSQRHLAEARMRHVV